MKYEKAKKEILKIIPEDQISFDHPDTIKLMHMLVQMPEPVCKLIFWKLEQEYKKQIEIKEKENNVHEGQEQNSKCESDREPV